MQHLVNEEGNSHPLLGIFKVKGHFYGVLLPFKTWPRFTALKILDAIPWLTLRVVFRPVNKLGRLSKLKSVFPLTRLSNVIYKVCCKDCQAFYVGLTTRRLQQRLHEHSTKEESALYRHSTETGHQVNFDSPTILDKDTIKTRLLIKETLHIQDSGAKSSLNRNIGSYELALW